MSALSIAVIGARGQLGTDLIRTLSSWDPVALTRAELDVCDVSRVCQVLNEIRPEVVINTAAFNRVDECEDEIEKAFSVNAYGARNVAGVCAELGCVLLHISTDYVFGGEKRTPYTEEDSPNPLSVYGVSKLAGEYFVGNLCPKHFIVRSSGLYGVAGSRGKSGNFVETMIRLAKESQRIRVVDDQVLAPTYTKDLVDQIKNLLRTEAYGLYHMTNGGQCSWYEFAGKIFELLKLRVDFGETTTQAFGSKARRPAYSVLACDKMRQLELGTLRLWSDALKAYLQEKRYL